MRRLILIVPGLLLTAGCSAFKNDCNAPQIYEGATSVAPIKAPEGLVAPNAHNALVVPAFDKPLVRRGPKDACLDAPPAYYQEAPKPAPASAPSPTPAPK
jgi:uncharacterized lipoprotein